MISDEERARQNFQREEWNKRSGWDKLSQKEKDEYLEECRSFPNIPSMPTSFEEL